MIANFSWTLIKSLSIYISTTRGAKGKEEVGETFVDPKTDRQMDRRMMTPEKIDG